MVKFKQYKRIIEVNVHLISDIIHLSSQPQNKLHISMCVCVLLSTQIEAQYTHCSISCFLYFIHLEDHFKLYIQIYLIVLKMLHGIPLYEYTTIHLTNFSFYYSNNDEWSSLNLHI